MWDKATNDAVKLVLAQPLNKIADVIKIQKELGVALASLDDPITGDNPVTAFNELYIAVTEEVEKGLIAGTYLDGPFMETLDIEFARLYFDAILNWVNGNLSDVKAAWQTLLKLEDKKGDRLNNIEGATLGVNAHINFDLTGALLEAVKKDPPGDMVARRADFDSINGIFEQLMDPLTKKFINGLKSKIAQNLFKILDWVLGDLDEDVTLALITAMRNEAWDRAEFFWAGTGGPTTLWDELTGFLSEVLLATGLFDREVEGVEVALGRASAELLASDLLLIESRDDSCVAVRSSNRRIPGEWVGENGDLAGLITADWLIASIKQQRQELVGPGPELDQLSADLLLIEAAHRRPKQLS